MVGVNGSWPRWLLSDTRGSWLAQTSCRNRFLGTFPGSSSSGERRAESAVEKRPASVCLRSSPRPKRCRGTALQNLAEFVRPSPIPSVPRRGRVRRTCGAFPFRVRFRVSWRGHLMNVGSFQEPVTTLTHGPQAPGVVAHEPAGSATPPTERESVAGLGEAGASTTRTCTGLSINLRFGKRLEVSGKSSPPQYLWCGGQNGHNRWCLWPTKWLFSTD
jgi:hypothetical protein